MERPLYTGVTCQAKISDDAWHLSAMWSERKVAFAPKRDFRRKGIGTALLRLIIQTASERKMKCVYGTVSAADLEEFPNMMDWLEEFAFKKSPPAKDVPFEATWAIRLELLIWSTLGQRLSATTPHRPREPRRI